MVSFNSFMRATSLFLALSRGSNCQNSTGPTRFGYVLFQGFEAIDVIGSIDALNLHALSANISLALIAETLDPVATNKLPWAPNLVNANFGESIIPTHTFATAPPLDVLVIPGGLATRAPPSIINPTIDFVREQYPTLQYLLTVCTGAGIAARAGVLDGKNATTNKIAWAETTALGPKVYWVAKARWVTDGNIWTSSGVSAGIDLMISFISHVWGKDVAVGLAHGMEYSPTWDPNNDPFATLNNVTDVPPVQT